jgi:hypothetical protein
LNLFSKNLASHECEWFLRDHVVAWRHLQAPLACRSPTTESERAKKISVTLNVKKTTQRPLCVAAGS